MCIQSALKLGKKEIEAAEELWTKARALVGGTSGEKSLEAAKSFMKLYESTISATPNQWAFGPPPPPSGPHPSGAEFEVKVSGLLDRFSGSGRAFLISRSVSACLPGLRARGPQKIK